MTTRDILNRRLECQQLIHPSLEAPGDVVRWMGAVQAQDYYGSLWAIGQRMKSAVESDIETAIAKKSIVRTWPMRGTLHFVSPENVRWMLKLLTPRIISRAAKQYRDEGLTASTFKKSMKIFERVLRDGNQLTRDEMYQSLERNKIQLKGIQGLFILGYAAQNGQICFGPRKGKQPTFTLLDEWIPAAKNLSNAEALHKLAVIYFKSHGPATLQDFVWWSGLTVADAKTGIDLAGNEVGKETHGEITYWFSETDTPKSKRTSYLLPTYDEYIVGYKDRSIFVRDEASAVMKGRADVVFNSTILVNGMVAGTWKRVLSKDQVSVKLNVLVKSNEAERKSLATVSKRYSKFIGLPLSEKK